MVSLNSAELFWAHIRQKYLIHVLCCVKTVGCNVRMWELFQNQGNNHQFYFCIQQWYSWNWFYFYWLHYLLLPLLKVLCVLSTVPDADGKIDRDQPQSARISCANCPVMKVLWGYKQLSCLITVTFLAGPLKRFSSQEAKWGANHDWIGLLCSCCTQSEDSFVTNA